MTCQPATEADRPAIIDLLTQADLLTDDLPANLGTFTLACADGQLVGVAGVEMLGKYGLLRSVAVLPAYKGQQIGNQLVDVSILTARNQSVSAIYLITTTADRYFERLGFARVERSNVPDVIAQTQQFSNLCPASAVVMKKMLASV